MPKGWAVDTGSLLLCPSAAFTTDADGHDFGTEEAPAPPALVGAVVGTLDLDVDVALDFDAGVAVGVALLLELELQALMNDAANATATMVVAIHRALPTTGGRNPNGAIEPP